MDHSTAPAQGSLQHPVADCGEHTADTASDHWYRQEQAGTADALDGPGR